MTWQSKTMRVEGDFKKKKKIYAYISLKYKKRMSKKLQKKGFQKHDTCSLSSDGQDVAGLTDACAVLGKHADVVR